MSNPSPFAVADTGGTALKVDLLKDAYSQLRISGLTVQPTPEDLEVGLSRMENMLAEWLPRVCIGWNFEEVPDPNSVTNIKRSYWHCVSTNLAARLIPDFNKQVPQSLLMQASQSFSSMSGSVAMDRVNMVAYPNRMPVGSGNSLKYNRWARFYRNQSSDINTCAIDQMYLGDITDFTEHFDAYLNDGEYILSFSITTDTGLNVITSDSTDSDVNYKIEATGTDESSQSSIRQITIIITTTSDRIETRIQRIQVFPRK